uniref:BHLH domain-containing protein n=1 Tax=Oryza glumipatula TaxID=40148 RepID=A0A0E0AL12_9ORYZ
MASPEGSTWQQQQHVAPATAAPNTCAEINGSVDCEHGKEQPTNKRPRSESGTRPSSKACREKVRRDKLNERFLELGAVLEPGKTPKMDKSSILNDAIRVMAELRSEAQKLKESNESLQEKIKELKAEKNELRDEKQKLKAEKESLEQQIKFLNARPSFVPHPPVIPATAFTAPQGQAAGQKLMMPVIGYPGFPMWQFMPPSDVDTTDDTKSCPPVA